MRLSLLLFALLLAQTKVKRSLLVYLCDSQYGKRYHYTAGCRGLRNCNYRTIRVSLEEAEKRGKTACLWEKQYSVIGNEPVKRNR